jgi:hypothetical protein
MTAEMPLRSLLESLPSGTLISSREIARRFGTRPDSVKRALRRVPVELRRRVYTTAASRVRALLDDRPETLDWSVLRIARLLQILPLTVASVLYEERRKRGWRRPRRSARISPTRQAPVFAAIEARIVLSEIAYFVRWG